ncbi:hypothetical protein [Acidithiobacillus ferrianus]|uniref:hypothetical protein n=1 Tax=Acidithiobacillus ferrianus TaxID=2678518 RepID=UPI0034E5C302
MDGIYGGSEDKSGYPDLAVFRHNKIRFLRSNAMNWKLFARTAATSIFSWRLIAREMAGFVLAWGAYLMASMLILDPTLQDSVPKGLVSAVQLLFWPTVVVSGISALVACVKSALPAAVALALAVPLYLLGFAFAAKVTLLVANAAVALYAVGFAFHGGRLRVANHS